MIGVPRYPGYKTPTEQDISGGALKGEAACSGSERCAVAEASSMGGRAQTVHETWAYSLVELYSSFCRLTDEYKGYIHRLADKYIGHASARPRGPIYSSVTNKYMVPHISPGTVAPRPSMFVDDVEPMNVGSYIHRCHVTNEYILNSSVLMNTLGYIYQQYIHRRGHRLTGEFKLYLSVKNGESSYFSCSEV
jgi:hypothetical protein